MIIQLLRFTVSEVHYLVIDFIPNAYVWLIDLNQPKLWDWVKKKNWSATTGMKLNEYNIGFRVVEGIH